MSTTIQHSFYIGIREQALRWPTSFLTERTQTLSYAGRRSPQCWLSCGVPQGLILGPLLFGRRHRNRPGTWNSNPRICRRHPDLHQLRRFGSSTRCHSSVGLRIGNESWMSSNRLKLNALKTEFIWIGTRQQLSKVEEEALMICGQSVTPMVKVRDLGVFIDRELTIEAHVSKTVRGCMYQLRSVKRSLTLDSRRALATAFVASRINYCNGVLYSVAKGKVQRLQMVLNAAARLVVGMGKFSHVTPILRDVLHWLPVQHRISYKNRHTGSGLYSRHGPGLFR